MLCCGGERMKDKLWDEGLSYEISYDAYSILWMVSGV
jgi:hypothetical protein